MTSTLTHADKTGLYETRIDELLAEMTLTEKVGQLTQFSGFHDVTGPAPAEWRAAQKHHLLQNGLIGSMLNVVGVEAVRNYQKFAVENSRLGIPMMFAYDVIHGQKTMCPIPLAEAASWDLNLIRKSARVAAIEAAAQGLNWTFAPMVDVSREPRWGRVMEGAGEDPYLGSRIAEARVKGFQGDNLSANDTILATIKHFAAYGFAEAGKEYNTAEIGTTTLHNMVLPPFDAALKNANPRSVMNAFNTVNGIPGTGDAALQRDWLKGNQKFDGVVVSDWGSALEMIAHGFVADEREAAKVAILAGSDIDMESYVYLDHLENLVESGEVDEAVIDDAVRRVLRVKFELGLFDDPYRYIDSEREQTRLFTESHLNTALAMARKSIVLLKNERGALPLSADKKIALIGALAVDQDAPLGNWRADADAHSAMSIMDGFDEAGLDYVYSYGVTVQLGDSHFEYPVHVNYENRDGFDEAVAIARDMDQVVLVVGETARMSGEGRSRADIGLPGLQQELLEAIHAVNPNIVLIVMSGRPLVLSWADANVPAIVQVWHLGHRSGGAITDVLTGKENPSGKLPMSFPRSVGQIPIYYNHLNTGRPGPRDEVTWAHYSDEKNSPLYAFGHGLSYTWFEYSDLTTRLEIDHVDVSFRVKNAGHRDGEEVAQLYIRDRVASIARPVKELKGFEKVHLSAGETKRIHLKLKGDELGFFNTQGNFVIEQGEFDVFVGGTSDAPLHTMFNLSDEHIMSFGAK
ncbi:MAG: beta-glucosidase BglX [Hyphomonadaceae bacterium]|nr:beta-glucosidase BglX [Hyphomonadaceae bacterium]